MNALHCHDDVLNVDFEDVDIEKERYKAYYGQNNGFPSDLVFWRSQCLLQLTKTKGTADDIYFVKFRACEPGFQESTGSK